jgi:hypothetical protein
MTGSALLLFGTFAEKKVDSDYTAFCVLCITGVIQSLEIPPVTSTFYSLRQLTQSDRWRIDQEHFYALACHKRDLDLLAVLYDAAFTAVVECFRCSIRVVHLADN